MNGKYNAVNIPMGQNSRTIFDYKNQLSADGLTVLEGAINFDWDDKSEKETLVKLSQYLKDHENQMRKLIGLKIGQEAQDRYKDELALMAKDGNLDANKMSKIIYEKFGDTPYKFTTYKTVLYEAIMQCKQLGAPQEMVAALETLNKNCNYLFTNALDQERTSRESVDKQEKLFKAELDNKHAIKDFYQEAQRHVQQASHTVSRFSEEMDRQCRAQRSVLDSCSSMLQNIMHMFTTWGVRSEQQTDRVVYEVRQEGRTTRDAVRAAVTAKNIAVERKLTDIERAASQAHLAAQQAKHQAAVAQNTANAALPPLPPATSPTYQPPATDEPIPSAPPLEDLEKKK